MADSISSVMFRNDIYSNEGTASANMGSMSDGNAHVEL